MKHQALQICASAEDIADKLVALYHNTAKRAQQIEHASAVLRANSGAVARYWGKIEEVLQGSI